jgi:hypothetical protein
VVGKYRIVNDLVLRLQVASKYMPTASIKIGVDLDPIKAIKGCVTF